MKKAMILAEDFFHRRGGMILQVAVILIWAVMMMIHLERTFFASANLPIQPALITPEGINIGEEWWGVYWRNEKIGTAVRNQSREGGKIFATE